MLLLYFFPEPRGADPGKHLAVCAMQLNSFNRSSGGMELPFTRKGLYFDLREFFRTISSNTPFFVPYGEWHRP